MKIRYAFILIALSVFVSSCGPIIGQLMRMSDGIKSFNVTEGKIENLKRELNLLVVGPFTKTERAFYIARGDEAAWFANEFEKTRFFKAEAYIGKKFGDLAGIQSLLKKKNSVSLKNDLGLKAEPDVLVFGTVLERETIVAPTRGIIMKAAYRLEFYNIQGKSSTILEVTVKDHFKDSIATVVQEIVAQIEQ